MADLENGLWGSNISKSKELPTVGAAFVTAMIKGDSGNHWAVKGGDANQATLTTLYDGVRLFVCYVVCNVYRARGFVALHTLRSHRRFKKTSWIARAPAHIHPHAACCVLVSLKIDVFWFAQLKVTTSSRSHRLVRTVYPEMASRECSHPMYVT